MVNPPNDAADVASALRKLGFDVVEGRDLDKRAMESKVIEFSRKLDNAGMALFFYAGHGMQVGGRNYLIPIDAKLERGGDLSFETLDVSQVLSQMEAEKRVNLVFLDACRDNPLARSFSRSLGTRSAVVGQGLASIQSAVGTMIVYATQPDNVALDGDGTRNSPFTGALLKHIATPGLEVRSMMTRVRSDVLVATRDKQVPWDHSSLTSDVILTPALATSAIPTPPTTAPASDEIAWSFLKDTNDASQLRRFAEQYPASPRRNEAAARILKLEQTKVAALPPAAPVVAPAAPQSADPVRTSAIVNNRNLRTAGGGFGLGTFSSAAECRDACVKNRKCEGWTYRHALYDVPSLQKHCSGEETPNNSVSNYEAQNISSGVVKTVSAPAAPVRTSEIVKHSSIRGATYEIFSASKLTNAAACRAHCVNDKKCKAWQYEYRTAADPTNEAPGKECRLFDTILSSDPIASGGASNELLSSGVVKTERPAATSSR